MSPQSIPACVPLKPLRAPGTQNSIGTKSAGRITTLMAGGYISGEA